ncbi:phage portal protein [Virgibacillus dokdonensis]|uniref:Phage portal protein n=1 Tax=Virgibacillus dokdonensis TaxID=302167 RepID=A0A2K9J4E6_9BACI|nr:phage portal protein [Virgibacillus dokdonensis]AUJ23123.1 Phage portal protein [Virgibacillus dokdonensis]AUJ26555.1 Phage portal protein [Virgibacillus dokdonensis]
MSEIGLLDVFKKNSELEYVFDLDLLENTSQKVQMKKMAIQTCIDLIARTISMSEFRVRDGSQFIKNEIYYRLNVKPNRNQIAATFWQKVIYKLIYDNECLIIQSKTDDLLVADSFTKMEYAVYSDIFKDVVVKNHEFKRSFRRDEVIYLEYKNEKLAPIIDGLYADYGELFTRIINAQKRKSQIRSTVDIDTTKAKGEEGRSKLQSFVNKLYRAFADKDIAIVPQQNGYTYSEHSKDTKGQAVDEVDKVSDGFLVQVARSLGIPPSLVKGEMADVENLTRNFMLFCVDPILKKVKDELNAQLFTKEEYFSGIQIKIKRARYRDIFDVASAVDKIRGAGVGNGNELRDELGWDPVDDPILEEYVITKNYADTTESFKGGEE